MTKEEKQLLLQDLCARLPYGVNIKIDGYNISVLKGIDGDTISTDRGINYPLRIVKPYLRPMESMTEEEITEIYEFARPYIIEEIKHGAESDNPDRKVEIENGFLSNAVIIDELNKRHIDYRGLIPKGLALPATEGMYNN